ncbi:MAG TPA: hypothetical protein DC049_10725 [Spirochaetia bacterium]|nr:hypothetical protein [Spirochaetia bacterium]
MNDQLSLFDDPYMLRLDEPADFIKKGNFNKALKLFYALEKDFPDYPGSSARRQAIEYWASLYKPFAKNGFAAAEKFKKAVPGISALPDFAMLFYSVYAAEKRKFLSLGGEIDLFTDMRLCHLENRSERFFSLLPAALQNDPAAFPLIFFLASDFYAQSGNMPLALLNIHKGYFYLQAESIGSEIFFSRFINDFFSIETDISPNHQCYFTEAVMKKKAEFKFAPHADEAGLAYQKYKNTSREAFYLATFLYTAGKRGNIFKISTAEHARLTEIYPGLEKTVL